MKLINPSYKIIPQESGLNGIYKAIELAGRTCYKSENKITETSAKEFVDRMIKNGHLAMLEFGTVYLFLPKVMPTDELYKHNAFEYISERYSFNKFSKLIYDKGNLYIITNLRILVENNWLDDLKYLCEPTERHEKRVFVKFITDIGVSREMNRHRVDSIAEMSTRYCNFSKDKFGNEISVILPQEFTKDDVYNSKVKESPKDSPIDWWLWANECSELAYLNLIKLGWTAQQARRVLPLDTMTELNHCAFVSDWKHFFELRDNPAAHPDMQNLAGSLHKEFIKLGYIDK